MAQLKERDTDETVDGQLIPEEVERLRELGVEVEESEQDGEGGGSGSSGSGSDEESQEETDEDGSSGDGNSDGDQEGDSQGEEESGGSGGSEDDDGDTGDQGTDFTPDNSGLDPDDLDELEQESDIAGGDGQVPDDLDEQVEGVKVAGGGEGMIKIDNFDQKSYNTEWERIGGRFASQLGGMLVDHFRQERRSDVRTGQRSGTFDSNKLIEADRGSPRVFKSEDRPDEKKYHAVICMDDSGSMHRDGLKEACITTGMLAQALEKVGIETTVYRFARNIRLVKSPAQSYDETKDKIYEDDVNGGTMLLPAIEQAEEIAKHHADETFLVVVTDGRPSSESEIKDRLTSSKMSSITVQIGTSHETFRGSYDGWVYVENTSDVPSKTQSAFRRVML